MAHSGFKDHPLSAKLGLVGVVLVSLGIAFLSPVRKGLPTGWDISITEAPTCLFN